MRARTSPPRSIAIAITTTLAITIAAITTGCPGRLASPERFGPGGGARSDAGPAGDGAIAGSDVPAMLAAECGSSGCHGSVAPALGLDLVSPGVADRLRTATAVSCMVRPLIDPANPDASFLLEKVTDAAPQCGTRMPLGRDPLSSAELAALRAWIAAQ